MSTQSLLHRAGPAGYDDPVLKALAAAQNPSYYTWAPWGYRPFISANFPTPEWPTEYFTNGEQPASAIGRARWLSSRRIGPPC